jgi:hypothetical protein
VITRTRCPTLVNGLAGKQGQAADYSELLADPLHVCLVDGDSGALFAWRGPGIYEVHVFFAVRGRRALDLIADMLDFMRDRHGARYFWGLIPIESRHVLMFARLVGWKSHGIVKTRHGWQELFSEGKPCLLH